MAAELLKYFVNCFEIEYFDISLSEEVKILMAKLIGYNFETFKKFDEDISEARCQELLEILHQNSSKLHQYEYYLKDVIRSCCIVSILKLTPAKYDHVFKILKEISSQRIRELIEKNFAASIACEELLNDESVEKVEEFAKCGLMMINSSAADELKKVLVLATSNTLQTRSKDLKVVDEQLKSLKSAAAFEI